MPHPMKRKNLWRMILLWIGGCMWLVAPMGCATLDQMIQKPTAVFSDFQLTNASLLHGTAVFTFNVRNPNPIRIRAGRINYDLKLDGTPFIKGELDQGISLAAGSTSRMSIPVTMQYLDFYQSVSHLWQNKSADYLFSGGFSVGPFVIPFRAEGRFNLPKMPTIALESIQIKKHTLSGATLNCRLKLNNPNAFNLMFKRLNYDLKLNGAPIAKASALPRGPIAKNSQSIINLGFDVSYAQLGNSVYQLLRGSKADYTLDGGLIFDTGAAGNRQVPFHLSGRVPFIR